MWSALLLLFCSLSFADSWDDVLRQASLEKSQVRFNALDLKQGGGAEFKSPTFELLHGEPLRIPYFTRTYRQVLTEWSKEPFKVSVSALARVGLGVRRNLEGDPLSRIENLSKKSEAVLLSLEFLHHVARRPLTPAQKNEITAKSKSLSAEAKASLAYLIASIAHSIEWRNRALEELDPKIVVKGFAERTELPDTDDDDLSGLTRTMKRLLKDVDMTVLTSGGVDLVLAVQNQREKLSQLKSSDKFEWASPFGLVSLRGGKTDDVVKADRFPLLVIDAAGNDTYFAGGGADLDHPVGIVIDLAGDDKYLASPSLENLAKLVVEQKEKRNAKFVPLFGAGVFGYGILIDAAGNDVYRSYRMTQGQGDFGLGFLWDLGGNDHYECWTQCQGSAEFGLGFLLDVAGTDTYSAMTHAQGFGGTLGSGVLFDLGKDMDTYTAVGTPVDFPSQVDKKFNVSFSQGAALGVRADGRDGHNLAGGFGALIDGGGDNTFTGGFFTQGVGYWYGVGWLSAGEGNDKYKAGKYAEGASTHYAVGILQDIGGNDSYEVEQELGIGHGHDFSVGFLVDEKGDDTYRAPNFSLGCASAQGIGVLWDRSGNDTYESSAAEVLGCASLRIDIPTTRVMATTIGVFLDSGGTNQFRAPGAKLEGKLTSRKWQRPAILVPKFEKRMQEKLVGVGLVTDKPDTEDPF